MVNKGSLVKELLDKTAEDKVLVSSYLIKRTKKTHTWKKKWVVLRNCQLSYYKDSSEHKPIKVIPRSSIQTYGKVADSNVFHFAIYTDHKTIHFKAYDETTYRKWMRALDNLIRDDEIAKETRNLGSSIEELEKTSKRTEYNNLTSQVSGLAVTEDTHQKVSSSDVGKLEAFEVGNPDEFVVERGYLNRVKGLYNQKKKYFVVLTNKFLYFYKGNFTLKHPHKKLLLAEIMDVIERNSSKKGTDWCFLVITPFNRIKFFASSEADMIKWLSSLKALSLKIKQI